MHHEASKFVIIPPSGTGLQTPSRSQYTVNPCGVTVNSNMPGIVRQFISFLYKYLPVKSTVLLSLEQQQNG